MELLEGKSCDCHMPLHGCIWDGHFILDYIDLAIA